MNSVNLVKVRGTALKLFFFFLTENKAQMCTSNQSLHYFSKEFALWLLFPLGFTHENKSIQELSINLSPTHLLFITNHVKKIGQKCHSLYI